MPRTAVAEQPKPAVRMVSRPLMPTLSDVPPPIKDYLKSNDKRWNWQRKDDVQNFWGTGIEALTVEELPADIQADLKKYGIKPTAEGWIQRHDSVLCTIPQGAWDELMQQEAIRRERMERGYLEELDEQIQDVSRGHASLQRPRGRKSTPGSFVATGGAREILDTE